MHFWPLISFLKKWAKTSKKYGYNLNFSSIFGHLYHFWKSGEKLAKSKAIALNFRPFLATYNIFEKVGENEQKVRL